MFAMDTLIRTAGGLHVVILAAAAFVPHILDWRGNLANVSSFMRRLVWVYGAFIGLVVAGFGAISMLQADHLAAGGPLARSLCGFIALFWLTRLAVQVFVFDEKPFMTRMPLRIGFHALTALFVLFVAIYGLAAFLPH